MRSSSVRTPTRWTVAAATLVALVALGGCGGSDPGSSGGTTAATAAGLPEVSGGFGKPPEVTVPDGTPPDTLQVKVLEKGDGPTVKAGDLLVADYVGLSWDGGDPFDSSFDRGQPASFAIGVNAVIPGWDQGLVGQTVGSRVLLVIPPDLAYGDTPPTGSSIKAGATLVFVVDIVDAVAADASADGKATPAQDDGVPSLTVGPGVPELGIPAGDAPPKLIAYPVVTGDGPVVQKGDLVVVQYVGKIWRTGKVFDSSWDRGQPVGFPIGVGSVIAGWDQGLVGQTVGSRVLLVIPPDLAYGDNPPPGSGIQAGDTLVFAVDILGAY
jgi:FKBP-type peptidyl-prolyl cis-trans isomerase